MSLPPDPELAPDALDLVLASRLASYDEALRSRVGPPPAEDGAADLSPDALQRLRQAQCSLRLLNQARPVTERSRTAVPSPFRAAAPTAASAAELQTTKLLSRRLRVGYLCSAITLVYALFVCRSGLYEELIGPVGALISYGVLAQTGELLTGLTATATAASAVLLWTRRPLAYRQLRSLEAGNFALVILMPAYWHFRFVTVRPAEGFASAVHQDTWILGHGGMGVVYRAEHRLLKRPCAVKLIRPDRAGDAATLACFEREVQATAPLRHPNVVEIYDYGRGDDGTFTMSWSSCRA